MLRVAQTRSQNRVFENLSESQKLWVTSNSGETQTWLQLLPLTHMDNALTNFEFRAIFQEKGKAARISRNPKVYELQKLNRR